MHLPQNWEIAQNSLTDRIQGWPLNLLRKFGQNILNNGYWLGQWIVFPNQPEEDLRETYQATLEGVQPQSLLSIHPYDASTEFCGVMIVPPLPQCSEVFTMKYRDEGKVREGEWPVYFHTLLPLYREEIVHYFKEGRESLLQKLMVNGVEAAFDLNRPNVCK